ncbi:MAG: hypothetical protein H0T05_00700 [Acidobacteria bacterium]|nr:hypothetical protein [Acidobacteriota bacterium]
MILLTASLDVQQTPAYESALALLTERHSTGQVMADRDLFEDAKHYNRYWKQVYDPEQITRLYVLAREDGTIGGGVYRQWRRLSKKHDVPATLLLPSGEQAAEVGSFEVSVLEESERTHQVFAVVNPDPSSSDAGSLSKSPHTDYPTDEAACGSKPGRAPSFLPLSSSWLPLVEERAVLCILIRAYPTPPPRCGAGTGRKLAARRAQVGAHSPREGFPIPGTS